MNKAMLAGLLAVALSWATPALAAGDGEAVGGKRLLAPENVAPPLGAYSLGVESKGPMRWVHVAGQTGVASDGTTLDGFAAQAGQAMDNVRAILAEAGMTWADVVSFRIYIVGRDNLAAWREIGGELLSDGRPAGTLVLVDGLVNPAWLIEIEATAAKPVHHRHRQHKMDEHGMHDGGGMHKHDQEN